MLYLLIGIPYLYIAVNPSNFSISFFLFAQDYRNEVGEILVADKRLTEEIEFDLKMLEEKQKKAAAAKAATVSTPQAATPHAQMVSTHTLTSKTYIPVHGSIHPYAFNAVICCGTKALMWSKFYPNHLGKILMCKCMY